MWKFKYTHWKKKRNYNDESHQETMTTNSPHYPSRMIFLFFPFPFFFFSLHEQRILVSVVQQLWCVSLTEDFGLHIFHSSKSFYMDLEKGDEKWTEPHPLFRTPYPDPETPPMQWHSPFMGLLEPIQSVQGEVYHSLCQSCTCKYHMEKQRIFQKSAGVDKVITKERTL